MPANTRKSTPRRAPAVVPEPAVERFDILEELAIDGGDPLPITIKGVDTEVRRYYTGEEAATFHALIAANKIVEAVDLITDGAGRAIWDAIDMLPPAIVAKLLNKVISMSGLSEGELRPLSPPSSERMAGAVLSQAVDDGLRSISEKPSEPSRGETAAG